MAKDENVKEPAVSRLFTPDGKPIRVLSTSLGIALLANALFIPGGAGASGSTGGTGMNRSWYPGLPRKLRIISTRMLTGIFHIRMRIRRRLSRKGRER